MPRTRDFQDHFHRGDNQIRTGDDGVADRSLTTWLCRHMQLSCVFHTAIIVYLFLFYVSRTKINQNDSDGNRTRVTTVKGWCLNRLTTEPHTPLTQRIEFYHIICGVASTFYNKDGDTICAVTDPIPITPRPITTPIIT